MIDYTAEQVKTFDEEIGKRLEVPEMDAWGKYGVLIENKLRSASSVANELLGICMVGLSKHRCATNYTLTTCRDGHWYVARFTLGRDGWEVQGFSSGPTALAAATEAVTTVLPLRKEQSHD